MWQSCDLGSQKQPESPQGNQQNGVSARIALHGTCTPAGLALCHITLQYSIVVSQSVLYFFCLCHTEFLSFALVALSNSSYKLCAAVVRYIKKHQLMTSESMSNKLILVVTRCEYTMYRRPSGRFSADASSSPTNMSLSWHTYSDACGARNHVTGKLIYARSIPAASSP